LSTRKTLLGCERTASSCVPAAVAGLSAEFNQAIEDGLIDRTPAGRLGRLAKSEKPPFHANPLTQEEAELFLQSTLEVCPEYYPLFLTALRTGLRRRQLVALEFGDIQFGSSDKDSNRYIFVRHNYVNRQFTTPKSKKSRPRRSRLGSAKSSKVLQNPQQNSNKK